MFAETLILNSNWQPIEVGKIKRVFNLMFRGKVDIITFENGFLEKFTIKEWEEYSKLKIELGDLNNEKVIKSDKKVYVIPKIIRITTSDRTPFKIELNKTNLILRDDNTCQYCGVRYKQSELNMDHVYPKSLGGKRVWINMVTSCYKCNQKKGNKTLDKTGMKLIKQPEKPSRYITFRKYINKIDDDFSCWKYFFPEEIKKEMFWGVMQ